MPRDSYCKKAYKNVRKLTVKSGLQHGPAPRWPNVICTKPTIPNRKADALSFPMMYGTDTEDAVVPAHSQGEQRTSVRSQSCERGPAREILIFRSNSARIPIYIRIILYIYVRTQYMYFLLFLIHWTHRGLIQMLTELWAVPRFPPYCKLSYSRPKTM